MPDLLDQLLATIENKDASPADGKTDGTQPANPPPTAQKSADDDGATTLDIEGETFRVREDKDSLDRAIYRIEYGDISGETQQYGIPFRGSVARFTAPKDTGAEQVQRLVGMLALHKSATIVKQNSFDDALEDALASAGGNALYAGWWAFCQFAMDSWEGTLEDIDDATYNDLVDKLAQYLKTVWGIFSGVDQNSAASIQKAAGEALVTMKAGARLSRASRESLEKARAEIDSLLEGKKGDPTPTPKDATSDPAPATQPDVTEQKGLEAEVENRLKAKEAEWAKERDELRQKLAQLGGEPLPDPLDPGDGDAGKQQQKAVSWGNSIYDTAPAVHSVYGG